MVIKNSDLVPKLESVDLFLVQCNLVNNSYQQASKILFTFVPNKKYGQLITVSPEALIMLKTVNSEFSFIEIWFRFGLGLFKFGLHFVNNWYW